MTAEQIAFALGIISTVCAVLSLQFKNMFYVLFFQLVTNTLLCIQYIIEGGDSAGLISVVAVVQTLICFIYNRCEKRFPVWFTLLFIAAFTVITVINYKTYADIFCCLAVWFFALCVVQKYSFISRACSLINCTLWLIYDILAAPSAILTHAVVIAFVIFSIIRIDRHDWKAFFVKMREKNNKIDKTT